MFDYVFSWDAFWSQTTAAWVQAIGALGALVVVILIDRFAAERLRRDRAAEWAKRREERDAERSERERQAKAIEDACKHAIHAARFALQEAALSLRNLDFTEGQTYAVPDVRLRAIRAARAALAHQLAHAPTANSHLLGALALTLEVTDGALDALRWTQPLRAEKDVAGAAGALANSVEDISEILEDLRVAEVSEA